MYKTKNENNKEIYKIKEKETNDKKLFIENILIVITIVKFIKIKIYENKTYSK